MKLVVNNVEGETQSDQINTTEVENSKETPATIAHHCGSGFNLWNKTIVFVWWQEVDVALSY